MKKIIALTFMMAYGMASMAIPVAAHQCGNKSFQTAEHHTGKTCCAENTKDDCCSNHQNQCKANRNDNVVELILYKEFNTQFQPLVFFGNDLRPGQIVFITSSLWNNNSPSGLYKIRLHLYNRVLLI